VKRILSAIACVLSAAALAPGLAFAEAYKGRCESSVVLGSAGWPELRALFEQQREVLKTARYDEAIAIQRKIVELQCHNHFQRYFLAELMVQAGRPGEAVPVLAELYALGVNDLEARLEDEQNALHAVAATQAFRTSALAGEIAANRAAHQQRRAAFAARLAALPKDQRPPDPTVAADVCPFECCSYGSWTAREDVTVLERPGSGAAVATIARGTAVESLTGQVHVRPIAFGVVHAKPAYQPAITLQPGAVVFLLDPMGEGFAHVWHQGRVHEVAVSGEVQQQCPFPAEDCWGEWIEAPPGEREEAWWAQIRLSDGTLGWAPGDRFEGSYGCG